MKSLKSSLIKKFSPICIFLAFNALYPMHFQEAGSDVVKSESTEDEIIRTRGEIEALILSLDYSSRRRGILVNQGTPMDLELLADQESRSINLAFTSGCALLEKLEQVARDPRDQFFIGLKESLVASFRFDRIGIAIRAKYNKDQEGQVYLLLKLLTVKELVEDRMVLIAKK